MHIVYVLLLSGLQAGWGLEGGIWWKLLI